MGAQVSPILSEISYIVGNNASQLPQNLISDMMKTSQEADSH